MTPDAAGLGRRIATAGLAPQAFGVHLKITGQVALVLRVAPKIQRHGGDGLAADEFAHFANDWLARFIPGLDCAT